MSGTGTYGISPLRKAREPVARHVRVPHVHEAHGPVPVERDVGRVFAECECGLTDGEVPQCIL